MRDYIESKRRGRYSGVPPGLLRALNRGFVTPLHSIMYSDYNKRNHTKTDGGINDAILDNLEAIKFYSIEIKTEEDLAKEIARIANLSMALGYKLEDEGRLLSKSE